ncbi:hypothetical protein PHMEG_00030113 [Phytophthora megakarya]|uniref:RxLR effector protein n=1 Tax=Phytophthora megakarya TaxID=4795 RepID=A0A225V2M2_9STRA|nr:hypothetical protein PHMEG_00030113 [Phytophthora megakarya]
MQIHSFGLLWLLTTVYIVRVAPMPWTATKHSPSSTCSLVLQRPLVAGGLLRIPLNKTVRLLQCPKKDVKRNIIRLQYGPKRKHITMRAANAVERKHCIQDARPSGADCANTYSLDAIKRLADGYDSLAQQWSQVATETKQFNATISSLHLNRIGSEHVAVGCSVC